MGLFLILDTIWISSSTKSAETDDNKIAMCASLELASCRAENWQLKKKLIEYEATIKNLEQLVTTIASKQHQILSEVVELRKESRAASMSADLLNTSGCSSVLDDSFICDDEEEEDGYKADSDSGGSHCPTPRSLLASAASASSVASLTSLGLSSISSLDSSDISSVSEIDLTQGEATRSDEDDDVPSPISLPVRLSEHYNSDSDSDGD